MKFFENIHSCNSNSDKKWKLETRNIIIIKKENEKDMKKR